MTLIKILSVSALFCLSELCICQADAVYTCPRGWIVFDDSCYFVSQKAMPFTEAKAECQKQGAQIFVADSREEWRAISPYAVRGYLNWLGIRAVPKKLSALIEINFEGQKPNLKLDSLPWIIKTNNFGYVPSLECAVFYVAPPPLNSSYCNWSNCKINQYFICERNSTVVSAVKHLSDSEQPQQLTTDKTPRSSTEEAPITVATTTGVADGNINLKSTGKSQVVPDKSIPKRTP